MALALLIAISGPIKVSNFQGPPLPIPLVMDLARLKAKHYVPRHINSRYINNYYIF
jgi:hypothetical protein